MKKLQIDEITDFVKKNIQTFHENRLKTLEKSSLKELLKKKNPYLFKAKDIVTAQELVTSFLEARLSASEEKIFGDFLEDLAIFVAEKTLRATKSSSQSIDLEYTKDGTRYLVSVKSGLNWGNSNQWKALEADCKNALRVLKQSQHAKHVQCILGICYGNAKTTIKRGLLLQVTGQTFWYIISGDEEFYTKIVKPLGHKAKEMNDSFKTKKAQLINKFTKEFTNDFCDEDGKILWDKLVMFNSGNLTEEDRKKIE